MRDPRLAPLPGDWLACGETLIRVDHVALGEILVAVFRLEAKQPCAVTSVPILEFARATRDAGVVVLPEDDPRQTATILEVR